MQRGAPSTSSRAAISGISVVPRVREDNVDAKGFQRFDDGVGARRFDDAMGCLHVLRQARHVWMRYALPSQLAPLAQPFSLPHFAQPPHGWTMSCCLQRTRGCRALRARMRVGNARL